MDKNTTTGLILIGLLLVGFSYFSRPSQEQQEAWQRYNDSIALVQQREADLKAKAEAALINEREALANDSTALFFKARQGKDELITIHNNLVDLTISTKGGRIYSSVLKEYMEQDKKTPVQLFNGKDVSMNFLFYNLKETIQTSDYYFQPVAQTDSSVVMRLAADLLMAVLLMFFFKNRDRVDNSLQCAFLISLPLQALAFYIPVFSRLAISRKRCSTF